MPKYEPAPERLVCRNCGWGETYDPEWPLHTMNGNCPACKQRTVVWIRYEEPAAEDTAS